MAKKKPVSATSRGAKPKPHPTGKSGSVIRDMINRELTEQEMTIPQLAEETGVTPAQLYIFLRKGGNPRLGVIEKCMKAVGLVISPL